MLGGWASVHRSVIDHWVAAEPELFAVWVRLILEANFEDKKKMFNGSLIEIKRGQLVFGLNAFSAKSGVSVKKLRRHLDLLEKEGMIGRQKTNKFSLISITNYEQYQGQGRQEAGQGQAEGKQGASKGQHRNNVNKGNNENKDLTSPQADDAQVVFDYWCYRMGKNASAKFSDKRRKAVVGRFKDGRTVEQIKQAIDGCAKTDFNMGRGPRSDGTVYDDLELICRNNEKFEHYLGLNQRMDSPTETKSIQQMAQEDPFNDEHRPDNRSHADTTEGHVPRLASGH